MKAFFSYGWDVTEVYHISMSFINNSFNNLQFRMHEPQATYEPLPTKEEFISYLQWPTNRPLYSKQGNRNASGSRAAEE